MWSLLQGLYRCIDRGRHPGQQDSDEPGRRETLIGSLAYAFATARQRSIFHDPPDRPGRPDIPLAGRIRIADRPTHVTATPIRWPLANRIRVADVAIGLLIGSEPHQGFAKTRWGGRASAEPNYQRA